MYFARNRYVLFEMMFFFATERIYKWNEMDIGNINVEHIQNMFL